MERVKYQSSKEKQSRGHGQSKMWKTFYNSCEDVTLLHIELSRTMRIAGFEQSFTRTVIYFFLCTNNHEYSNLLDEAQFT